MPLLCWLATRSVWKLANETDAGKLPSQEWWLCHSFKKKKKNNCTSTDALWNRKLASLSQKMLALLEINTCGTCLPDGANEKNLNDNIIYVVTYV